MRPGHRHGDVCRRDCVGSSPPTVQHPPAPHLGVVHPAEAGRAPRDAQSGEVGGETGAAALGPCLLGRPQPPRRQRPRFRARAGQPHPLLGMKQGALQPSPSLRTLVGDDVDADRAIAQHERHQRPVVGQVGAQAGGCGHHGSTSIAEQHLHVDRSDVEERCEGAPQQQPTGDEAAAVARSRETPRPHQLVRRQHRIDRHDLLERDGCRRPESQHAHPTRPRRTCRPNPRALACVPTRRTASRSNRSPRLSTGSSRWAAATSVSAVQA